MNFNKKVLISELKQYRDILNSESMDYLNGLVNLKRHISENPFDSLSELKVYRNIARYNIYKRAVELFKEDKKDLVTINNLDYFYVKTNIDNRNIPIFAFSIKNGLANTIGRIGEVYLNQIITDEAEIQKEIDANKLKIYNIYDNVITYNNEHNFAIVEDRTIRNSYEEVQKYKKNIKLLQERKDLKEVSQREIDLVNKYHELFFKEFGLNNKKFDIEGKLSYREKLILDNSNPGYEKRLVNNSNNIVYHNHISLY